MENTEGPCCLMTLCNNPKIYSVGMDFRIFKGNKWEDQSVFLEVNRLNARFLALPFPTIALINGHCFAAGLIFAMTHDFRIMRDDFGYCCLSEISVGMSIPRGTNNIVQAKIDFNIHIKLALFGHKFTPKEALDGKILDKLVKNENLINEGIKLGKCLAPKAQNRKAFKAIKEVMYENEIACAMYNPGDVGPRNPPKNVPKL